MANTAFNTIGTIISGSGSVTGSFAGFTIISDANITGLRDYTPDSQVIGPLYTASLAFNSASLSSFITPTGSFNLNGIIIAITGSNPPSNTSTTIYIASGSTPANTVVAISASLAVSRSLDPYSANILNILTTTTNTNTALLFQVSSSINGSSGNLFYLTSGSTTSFFTGGINSGSGNLSFSTGTTIPLYITSASLSSGAAIFYPVSLEIPRQ
jgi:hypothetical protein